MMRVLALVSILAATGVAGEPVRVAIDTRAGRLDERGSHSEILGYGGRPIEVRWQGPADGEVALVVRQLTSSRSIPRESATLAFDKGHATWQWTLPEHRGVARYRVELATDPPATLTIVAHDAREHERQWAALAKARVRVTGLSPAVSQKLRSLGLNPKVGRGETPTLVLESPGQATRSIHFRDEPSDQVVWVAVPGEGGPAWKVSAPLTWLDAAVLDLDEGRIRLLKLLTESPDIPVIP